MDHAGERLVHTAAKMTTVRSLSLKERSTKDSAITIASGQQCTTLDPFMTISIPILDLFPRYVSVLKGNPEVIKMPRTCRATVVSTVALASWGPWTQ